VGLWASTSAKERDRERCTHECTPGGTYLPALTDADCIHVMGSTVLDAIRINCLSHLWVLVPCVYLYTYVYVSQVLCCYRDAWMRRDFVLEVG